MELSNWFVYTQNYRFSPDELRVIKECELESFYNRSLPFGLGLGTASFLAVRNGYLKVSEIWFSCYCDHRHQVYKIC